MVRLLFRPYTQEKRTSCTSVSLQASTRVSMTLPFSSTVHHLSGPSAHALTQTALKITVGCRCTYPSIHFRCACRFTTRKLAQMLACTNVRDLGSCFETGRTGPCSSETNAKNRTTTMNRHFNHLAFERQFVCKSTDA